MDVGCQAPEEDETVPVVWVEPPPGAMMPSQYLKSYIEALVLTREQAAEHLKCKVKLPNLEQQRFLALCAEQLDVAIQEENDQVQWKHRSSKVYRLFSEGGCGKTWLIHAFIVPTVLYTFQGADAIRLIAFTNAQSANLSSATIRARTLHTACGMTVQKLSNELLAPGKKLKPLMEYWEPVRVVVLDEIGLCPAEAANMGMLRSAFGRQELTKLDIGDYCIRGNYWGKIPLVLQLGDPLQNRPVRAISLFDSDDMLAELAVQGDTVSVEAQTGIRVFRDADHTMQLVQTKRFRQDDPLPLLLRSLRRADAAKGKLVDPALWTLYTKQCASVDQQGNVQRDQRLLQPRLQDAYTLHLYWAGVVRSWFGRAQRDARRLGTSLYWVRAPYEISGLASQKQETQLQVHKQLMRTYNIHYTGHLHCTMLLHVGQRVKLTEKISAADALVQEATGTFLRLVPDPAEPPMQPDKDGNVILKYMPLGAWVHMDACVTAPLANELLKYMPKIHDHPGVPKEKDGHHFAEHIIFVPCVQRSFKKLLAGTTWTVKMRQMPFTSGKDRTIQSSQGMTLEDAATVIDMGNLNTQRENLSWGRNRGKRVHTFPLEWFCTCLVSSS